MLLRDISPQRSSNRSLINHKIYSRDRDVAVKTRETSLPKAKVSRHPATTLKRVVTPVTPTQIKSTQVKKQPLWLKSLIVLNHSSALICYVSVAITLAMYGMTVYAPKLWTQKYNELRDLQKQERQFTFSEEVLKNESAKSAEKSGSGFINPNPTEQPIFLPNIDAKPIELNSSIQVTPKTITPIFPIAY